MDKGLGLMKPSVQQLIDSVANKQYINNKGGKKLISSTAKRFKFKRESLPKPRAIQQKRNIQNTTQLKRIKIDANIGSYQNKFFQPKSTLSKPQIRRLARRGGCKRISFQIYEDIRRKLYHFIDHVIHDSALIAQYAHRNTITPKDIVWSLKRDGRVRLLGHGM